MSSSLGIFKRSLLKYLQFPYRNRDLFYIGDSPALIFHTRLGLNYSALKYHLLQKYCCPSPFEDPKHYFLYCPSFAALREKLFASAAHLLENSWHCAFNKKKVDWYFSQ